MVYLLYIGVIMDQDEQIKAVNDRLDRFENVVTSKLDILTEAMIKLARTEEKIVAMDNDRAITNTRLNRLSEKLDILSNEVADNSRTTSTINKFTWALIVGFIGLIFGITNTLIK